MNSENCAHRHTEQCEGNKVCIDCGIVLNEIFEQGGEIVPDKSDLYNGRSLRPETIDGGTQDPGTEKKNPLVEPILNQTLSTLGLLEFRTRVIAYYNAVDKNFIIGEGKLLNYVIAACALIVLREEKIPRTLREIAYLLELELSRLCEVLFMIRSKFAPNVTNFVSVEDLIIRSIGVMFEDEQHKISLPLYTDIKQLCHLKEDIQTYEKYREIDLPNNTESDEYREKMMKIYRVVFTGICTELLKYANDAFILSGRQPSFLGAAIALLAIEATEKPSVYEVKKHRKGVIDLISKIFMVDCHFVLFERYRELLDVIYHKVINIIPWCTHAKENKSRSYLYVTDLVRFQEWILGSRLKGKGKARDKGDVTVEERTNDYPTYNELIENNTGTNLIFTDISGFTSGFTSDNVNGQNNDSDIEFDEAELDEYMRDDDEVEMFKKVWESLQSNSTEKSEDKNVRLKKATRLKRLRGKNDVTNDDSEHHSSSESSSTHNHTETNIQNLSKNKRVRAEEPKSNVNKSNKLNIDPSLIENINFDDFDHI